MHLALEASRQPSRTYSYLTLDLRFEDGNHILDFV